MEFWPTARWKISVSTKEDDQWVEPDMPFALIGSHPCCSVQVSSRQLPEVIYLACCFADAIEVWPLCGIAFARWGVVQPEHQLIIGKAKVSFFHQTGVDWERISGDGRIEAAEPSGVGNAEGLTRQITLDWDGHQRPKTLQRRVTTVGADHPSTVRLMGQELAPCDHAVISVAGSVWMVNLRPGPEIASERQLIRRLTSRVAPLQMGRIGVRLGDAVEMEPPETAVHLRLPKSRELPTQRSGSEANAPSPVQPSPVDAKSGRPILFGRGSTDLSSDNGARGNRLIDTAGRTELTADQSSVDQRRDSAESLADLVTSRLVSISHAKFNYQRLIKLSLYLGLFLVCLALLIWILVQWVLPLVPSAE